MCQSETLRKRQRRSQPHSENASSSAVGYALTKKVVSHHATANDAWVIYKNNVYDITMFLESHPGGADVLYDKLGTDVTDAMSGDQPGSHAHSPFAYKMLSKYKIGHLADGNGEQVPDGNTDPVTGEQLVHWDKPILHQVGMLGDKYHRWIHSFPTTDHTVKMFTNDTIEGLTKCPWYVPLVFWLPVMALEMVHYIYLIGGTHNFSLVTFAAMVALGFIGWLFFEYTLHRFVFHMRTTGYYANIFHFLIHGHHHITPMDFDRLVFPPVPALLVGSPIWLLAPRLMGANFGYPWLLGFAVGYLVYDMTHFWIHHAVPRNSFLKRQKTRHVYHHYFQHSVNFGISNPLFDYVFRTISETAE
eukprot:TRINITY_DN48295_c0_g1_i1.p1 TRINITY_DN48295_c0_g1~~TRINITY_DN48295_c0_g1_i1.p1  ORF type:complete len:359 (-),score=45.01 TRINITY_DN48295_c0_g1_i1:274-1350(-)